MKLVEFIKYLRGINPSEDMEVCTLYEIGDPTPIDASYITVDSENRQIHINFESQL